MKIRTKTELGALARAERERRGMTQQELADRIGANRRWVNELENGRNNPTLERLLRCIDVLGLRLSVDTDGTPASAPSSLDRIISRSRGTEER
jgi:y4mF family transcriptional regulator